jgi:hypothetical protein
VWELLTGKVRHTLGSEGPVVQHVAFSPDGKLLAWSVGGGAVWVADAVTGKVLPQWPTIEPNLSALCFSPDKRVLAIADAEHRVHLRELMTGKDRGILAGHRAGVTGLAFSADGRTLLSASADTTVLLWEVAPSQAATPRREAVLDLIDLVDLYNDLKSEDGKRVYRAMWALAEAPKESIPFLNQRLRLTTPVDAKRLAKLLADLESPEFPVWEKAAAGLEELGPAGVPHLRKALTGKLSLPARPRLEQVLENVLAKVVNERRTVILRVLEVLERAGTPQAREVFSRLVEAEVEPWLTGEAKACLERLDQRPRKP